MEIQAVWILMVAIASPVVGVVAFLIQLRQLRMTHLQVQKLTLELEALKQQAADRDRRLHPVTNDEVQKYGDASGVRFQRAKKSDDALYSRWPRTDADERTPLRERIGLWSVVLVSAIVILAFVINAVAIIVGIAQRIAG